VHPTPESLKAEQARHARMIERAAERARILLAAACAACGDLAKRDPKSLHRLLPKLGTTGIDYDEWGTTLRVRKAEKAFATPVELKKALATIELPAIAIALGLEAQIDPAKTYSRIKGALPLEDTHFAPNFLEAYIQKALKPFVSRILAAMPERDIERAFIAGKIAIDDPLAARVPVRAIAKANLDYVHRDDVDVFLENHPIGADDAALVKLLGEIGLQDTHAALAFRAVLVDRFANAQYEPAMAVALKLHTAGIDGGFRLLLALGHVPTLEAELAKLPKVKFTPKFDRHHTKPELRPAIDAGYALGPETATSRFAPYFTKKAIASERGAVIAHDILVGGSLRSELTDPGWPDLLAPLAADKRLGPVVRPYLPRPKAAPSSKKAPKASAKPARSRSDRGR
jgi:hypothetical protein